MTLDTLSAAAEKIRGLLLHLTKILQEAFAILRDFLINALKSYLQYRPSRGAWRSVCGHLDHELASYSPCMVPINYLVSYEALTLGRL
ncbi:hypothetical protein PanWU01x14_049920, partial [Parasponia andersonii]